MKTLRFPGLGFKAFLYGDHIIIVHYDDSDSVGYDESCWDECPTFIRRSFGLERNKREVGLDGAGLPSPN